MANAEHRPKLSPELMAEVQAVLEKVRSGLGEDAPTVSISVDVPIGFFHLLDYIQKQEDQQKRLPQQKPLGPSWFASVNAEKPTALMQGHMKLLVNCLLFPHLNKQLETLPAYLEP